MTGKAKKASDKERAATRLIHGGRRSDAWWGLVNPPICHGSTVLFDNMAELEEATNHPFGRTFYGRMGTPTNFCFEEAVAELYHHRHAPHAVATSSGLSAVTIALTSHLKAGDAVLMADCVYSATRRFADKFLQEWGVEVIYYEPCVGAGIEEFINERVKVIFLESPGSLTFEVQDVPAIVAVAQRHDICTIMDNTWATALYFNPLAHGVDITVESATKYIVGHADAMLGIMLVDDLEQAHELRRHAMLRGDCASAERCYLGQRGLRTLLVRMAQHQDNALALAQFLASHDKVARLHHPAFESCHGHDIWKRDFTGASGLFAFELRPQYQKNNLAPMLDDMKHFGIGYSWGGYESLILPIYPHKEQRLHDWSKHGMMVRIHAGLEDAQDLIHDLDNALARLAMS